MRRNFVLVIVVATLISGCSTTPKFSSAARNFPDEGLITYRSVLSVFGKQFTVTGYVSRSEARGLRVIVTAGMGGVLGDAIVHRDGSVQIMRVSEGFPEKRFRQYLEDILCLFGFSNEDCSARVLGENHFLIKHPFYKQDLQVVEIKPGVQAENLFQPDN